MGEETSKGKLKAILEAHRGHARAIGMGELYYEVFGEPWSNRINDTRRLRTLVSELRDEGMPICSDSKSRRGGYYLADSLEEIDREIEKLKESGLKVLKRMSTLRKAARRLYGGQMKIAWKESSDAR